MRLGELPLEIRTAILKGASDMLGSCRDSDEFIIEVNKILGADYQSPFTPTKAKSNDQSN